MLLTRLSLHHVGPFEGEQTLDLTPVSADRPVILIGGLNGCGKTTILEAVLLALYGKLSPVVRDSGIGYDEYLRRLVNRKAQRAGSACIELDFQSRQEGSSAVYRITRSWSNRGKGVRERVDVQVDGCYDPVLTEHWQERVETFLPVRLSKLFFFDGERIESLADPHRAPEVISAAIHALLGIDIVVQLEADLSLLERRKAKEQQDDETIDRINALEEELRSIQSQRIDLKQRLASLTDPCHRAEGQLERLEAQFRTNGGEVAALRDQYEQEIASIEAELAEVQRQMIGLAAGPLPLRLIPDLLSDVLTQAMQERDVVQAQTIAQILHSRDAHVVGALRDAGLPAVTISKVERLLEKDRTSRLIAEPVEERLCLSSGTLDQIYRLITQTLEEQREAALQLLEQHDSLVDREVELQRALAASPDEESIRPLAEKIERCRAVILERRREQAQLRDELESIEHHSLAVNRDLERGLRTRHEVEVSNADISRFLFHGGRARDTLQSFRTRLIKQHVESLEGLILEGFTRLLRKERMVSRVHIDPQSCELALFDRDNQELPMERLSAGERQLLATAILWGLARAARRPLPVMIDTPLGRLDSDHRRHFVKRYLPSASHQVLVLSTDEEIDSVLLSKLRRHIGRTYLLDHDDKSGSTTITQGYFGEELIHAG